MREPRRPPHRARWLRGRPEQRHGHHDPVSSTDISSILANAGQSIISGATNSSLDVNTLVTTLVNAKTAGQLQNPADPPDERQYAVVRDRPAEGALSALQTALTGLSDGTALGSLAATASGTGIATTIKSGSGAVAGSYSVNVTQLATANKLSSAGVTSADTISAGSLSITFGNNPAFNVNVAAGASLSDIASSINSASGNAGVTASVITGSDGQHLVMQSNATGAANTISITGTGVNSKLTSGYDGHAGRRREADDRRHAGVERVEQRVGRADGRHAGAVAGRCRHDANRHAVAGHGRGDDRDQQFRDRVPTS